MIIRMIATALPELTAKGTVIIKKAAGTIKDIQGFLKSPG